MTFTEWLRSIETLLGDITDIIADADMLGALRLWYRRGWAPSDAADVTERGTGWAGEHKPRKLVLSWDHALGPVTNHMRAAQTLAAKLGWAGVWIEASGDDGASLWVNTTRNHDAFEVEAAP